MRFYRSMDGGIGSIVIIVVVHILSLAIEVGRALVLVGSSIVLVSGENLSNIATRVLVELLVIAKYYDGDIDRAEDGKLMCLLKKTTFALEKCDRAVSIILDGLDLNLSSPHRGDARILWKV